MNYKNILIATLASMGCSAPEVVPIPQPTLVDLCPATTTFRGDLITDNFAITVFYNQLQSKVGPTCSEYKIGSAMLIAKGTTDQYLISLHLKRGRDVTYVQVGGPFQDNNKDEYPLVNCKIRTNSIKCKLNSFFDPKSLQRTVNNPFKYEHGMVKQQYVSPCTVLESGRFNSQYNTKLQLKCMQQRNAELKAILPAAETFNALTKLIERES